MLIDITFPLICSQSKSFNAQKHHANGKASYCIYCSLLYLFKKEKETISLDVSFLSPSMLSCHGRKLPKMEIRSWVRLSNQEGPESRDDFLNRVFSIFFNFLNK
jgi:hypothetical protein